MYSPKPTLILFVGLALFCSEIRLRAEPFPPRSSTPPMGAAVQPVQVEPLKPRGRHHDTLFEKLSPVASGINMIHPVDVTHP